MTVHVIEPGCRTPPHLVSDDGSREFCPTCDYRPLPVAVVARRPWWRRLVDALPWRRHELQPDADAIFAAMREEWHRLGFRVVEPPPDGRPRPRSLPSPGAPRWD